MATEYYWLDHSGEHQIIDISFPLMKFPTGMLEQGQYSFPFSVYLPDWLPASFEIATDHEQARMGVSFRLSAKFIESKLNFTMGLVVMHPQVQNAKILIDEPSKFESEVGACCCKTPVSAQIFF